MAGNLHNLPQVLFRAFEKKSFAEDFINGKFRLGSLLQYRKIEGESRRDESEGTASYQNSEGIETISEIGNIHKAFLLCCSTQDVDLNFLGEKMGRYIVRISDSTMLARKIEAFLEINKVRTFNGIHGQLVEYTKNKLKDDELDAFGNFELGLRQKSYDYEDECEYRMHLILGESETRFVEGGYFHIDLGQPFEFAEII